MRRAISLAILLGACVASDNEVEDGAVQGGDTTRVSMPNFPAVESGHLSASTGARNEDYRFAGSWDATAVQCQDPSLFQLLAQGDGIGVIILIGPPQTEGGLGDYTVVSGATEVPDTSTARIGVQLFRDAARPHIFLGAEGTIELDRLDSVLAGRVAAHIVESSYKDTVLLAVSFDTPVQNGSDDWCQVVGEGGGPDAAADDRRTPVRSRSGTD